LSLLVVPDKRVKKPLHFPLPLLGDQVPLPLLVKLLIQLG
jgi:hypothetical protein